jgi:hypothetical protein
MPLVSPEILADARGLSSGAAGLLLAGGLLLWSHGWAWHRFWVVFGITMAAGVLGMTTSRSAGGQQVLVAGVLTAVAAGMVAMEAAKLLAFATGGAVGWVAFQAVFPHAQELWAAFLSGGLIGVVLFRLWTMLVTSFAGVLVAGHAGLVLANEFGKLDAAGWAGQNAAALNGAVVVATVLGVVLQAKLMPAEDEATEESHEGHGDHGEKQKNPKKKAAKPAGDHDKMADDHANDHGHDKHEPKRGGWKLFPAAKAS